MYNLEEELGENKEEFLNKFIYQVNDSDIEYKSIYSILKTTSFLFFKEIVRGAFTEPHLQNLILKDLQKSFLGLNSKAIHLEDRVYELNHELTMNKLSTEKVIRDFFSTYPLLLEKVYQAIKFKLCDYMTILKRLSKDKNSIQAFFNIELRTLVGIKNDGGDSHRGGKTVKILTFSDGFKLVYKPKSLKIDKMYNQVIDYINNISLEYSLKKIDSLIYDDYGWQEFVVYEDVLTYNDMREFYTQQGYLLALMYILNGTDMHNENIIASGKNPIIIDLETILSNEQERLSDNSIITKLYQKSVLNTLMLPVRFDFLSDDSFSSDDISGMLGRRTDVKHNQLKEFNEVNGKLKLIKMDYVPSDKYNIPKYSGEYLQPENNITDILNGFQEMYYVIMRRKNDFSNFLCGFKNIQIRYVPRPTAVYSKFLDVSVNPKFLRANQKLMICYLEKSLNIYSNVEKEFFIESEIRDLSNNDIPFYYTISDSTTLFDSENNSVENFFEKTCLEKVSEKIHSLSIEDLETQVRYIKNSLLVMRKDVKIDDRFESISVYSNEEIKHRLEKLFLGLKKCCVTDNINTSFVSSLYYKDELVYGPLSENLYDGQSGVLLALATYANSINNSNTDLSNFIYSGINYLFSMFDRGLLKENFILSGYMGVGSIVYTILNISLLLNDRELKNDADKMMDRLLDAISKGQIFNQSVEYISGLSSFTKLLLEYFHIFPIKTEKANLILKWIEDKFLTFYKDLKIGKENYYCGLAHGLTGIALGISSLYQITGNKIFTLIIKDLIEIENFHYNVDKWDDLRWEENKSSPNHWCHGTPGILLGRKKIQNILKDKYSQNNLLIDYLENSFIDECSPSFSLCHGTLGNFLIMSKQKENIYVYKSIEKYNSIENISLFLGDAGLIYYLSLCLNKTNKAPFVLLLDLFNKEEG